MYAPIPLDISTGVIKDQSPHRAGRRWVDTNLVRFWRGAPERWRGWQKYNDYNLSKPARGALAWRSSDGARMIAWGTATHLWLLYNGVLYDITPAGLQAGLVDSLPTESPWGGSAEIAWGHGTWNGNMPLSGPMAGGNPRTWSLHRWGNDLVACPRGGTIYHWSRANGPDVVAQPIPNAPISNLAIFTTEEDRHLVALGAHDGAADDPLRVSWANQETLTEWAPLDTNTAGDKRVERGNEIVGSIEVTGSRLLITDTTTYTHTYIGGQFVFRVERVDGQNGMIGPLAGTEKDGNAFWMGVNSFYGYSGGQVTRLECPMQRHIFDDINLREAHKVVMGVNRAYDEIICFYPSKSSKENNRYVSLNKDGWAHGELSRTTWLDGSVISNLPIATTPDGRIMQHDVGEVDENGAQLSYRLMSGDIYENTGEVAAAIPHMHSRRFVPDYDRMTGSHSLTILAKDVPRRVTQTKGPYAFDATTKSFPTRARGSSYQLLFEGQGDFRFGLSGLMVTKHGARSE